MPSLHVSVPRTTIPLTMDTRDRLKALGRKGETYDELVNRLIDHYLRIQARGGPVSGVDEIDFTRVDRE